MVVKDHKKKHATIQSQETQQSFDVPDVHPTDPYRTKVANMLSKINELPVKMSEQNPVDAIQKVFGLKQYPNNNEFWLIF